MHTKADKIAVTIAVAIVICGFGSIFNCLLASVENIKTAQEVQNQMYQTILEESIPGGIPDGGN